MAELNPNQSMDWVRSIKFDECDRNTVRLDSIDHAGMRVLLNRVTQQRITSNGKNFKEQKFVKSFKNE